MYRRARDRAIRVSYRASAMATPLCRFCFNCKAGIADRMTPNGHDPLQLE